MRNFITIHFEINTYAKYKENETNKCKKELITKAEMGINSYQSRNSHTVN